MSASAWSPRASLRAQVLALFATALVAFGVLGALHVQQREVRRAARQQLTAFRTARLDVAVGFAHVLGADLVERRAQGDTLVAQDLRRAHVYARSSTVFPSGSWT